MNSIIPRAKRERKKREPKRKRWAVADCETDSFDGFAVTAFVWAYLDDEGNREIFWSTTAFLDWLESFDGIVYAHNGGRFDWLMPEIVNRLRQGKIMLINGRVARAKIGKAEIRDSFLCLPSALEKFGEKMEFDYEILDRRKTYLREQKKADIEKYLMQDCVALFNAMAVYVARYGHALTQAGAALKTWEAMGGEKRRYGKDHDARFRPYYFGGRCEIFEYAAGTRGKFKMYDINSSYPAAMMQEHCCGTDYVASRNYKTAPGSSFWKIKAVSRGALPVRDDKGRIFYPRDDVVREFHTTGWEIHAALELGILDIHSADGLVPRRFETFALYVQKYFAERQEAKRQGDTIGDVIAKIFMNSLYGKFGANPEEYKDYKIVDKGERDYANGWHLSQLLDETDILERPTDHPQYFDVAVAASITGYARAAMMRGIFTSVRPMMCDTDSLLCEEFGGNVGSELGAWKFEGFFKAVWIAGKKCYALLGAEKKKNADTGKMEDWYKVAHKGVSKMDATVDDVKRAARGEIVKIKKSAPNCKIDGSQVFFSRKIKKT